MFTCLCHGMGTNYCLPAPFPPTPPPLAKPVYKKVESWRASLINKQIIFMEVKVLEAKLPATHNVTTIPITQSK